MVKHTSLRPSILQLKIVGTLYKNKDGITIKDIAHHIKTDYKNVYDAVEELFIKGIVKKEKIGNYNICKLNFMNDEIISYFKEYNAYIRLKEFKRKYPTEYGIIMENINQLTSGKVGNILGRIPIDLLSICLVFGSYSKEEERKDSDIDILFLSTGGYPDFGMNLKKVNTPYQKKFHIVNQQLEGFVKDLKNKKELSIARDIYLNPPIVFYGDDLFFRLMVEHSKLW